MGLKCMRLRRVKNPRSTVIFAGGLIGLGFETFYSLQYHQTPDSGLLVLFATMLGLPVFLTQDTRGSKNDERKPVPPLSGTDSSSDKEPTTSEPPPR